MYKKTVLPNGLRVVTHNIKGRHSVSIGLWIGVGGRYEADKVKGAAHFLEHIVFKGSKNYSCEGIKESIEGVGGMLNAFTSEEQTCYYAKIPSKFLNKTFDALADMVFHPQINKKDVIKESAVILEELKMYHDLPQYFVLELLDGLMWPNHPLGKSLVGTVESVTSMSNKDLKTFHKQYYTPANVVVAACGDLSHDKLVRLVKSKLAKLNGGGDCSFAKVEEEQSTPRAKYFKKDIEQMHLALGIPGYDEYHEDRYALSLLSVLLGGNMSSRLFVEVREKKGLAYSIGTNIKNMHDTGLFLIRAGVDNQKIVDAVRVILKELKKVKTDLITKSEFKRAKDYLLGQLLLGLEDTMEHMLWLGESMVAKNETRTLKEVVSKFEKLTLKDIQRVAKEIFNEKRYNLAIVGPINDTQQSELNKLLHVKN